MRTANTIQGESIQGVRSVVAALVEVEGGQAAFARKMGWGQGTVSRFLSGDAGLSARKARDLATAYPRLRKQLARAIFEGEVEST